MPTTAQRRFDAISDVAACALHLLRTGIAGHGQLACMGRSYGGYLTLAALTFHPELFAAGIDVCGMSDLLTFYADTEPWVAAVATTKYGDPVIDAELLAELSPLRRFHRLRAPLLVVHGVNDRNVPVGESRQAAAAARERGVETQLLLFPDEGHEIARIAGKVRFASAVVEFLTRHSRHLAGGCGRWRESRSSRSSRRWPRRWPPVISRISGLASSRSSGSTAATSPANTTMRVKGQARALRLAEPLEGVDRPRPVERSRRRASCAGSSIPPTSSCRTSRPGAAARLGLGSQELRASRPRLVTVDMSGYGPGGPYAHKKAYDMLVQSEAGLIAMTGSPEIPGEDGGGGS